jgi:proline iminopeptidase
VAALVTTGSAREVRWLTEDVGRLFPRECDRFVGAIPDELRSLAPVDAYAEMLWGPEVAWRETAALEWCRWEDAHVSLAPGHRSSPRYDDPAFRLRFARLVTHYWRHACFLGEDEILRRAGELDGLPVSLIHGRHDVSSPLETAWLLHRSIPSSELVVLGESGHGDGEDFVPAVIASLGRQGRSQDRG